MNPDIVWHDLSLGVMTWNRRASAYELRINRRDDLPLSFNVWTKVGIERPFGDQGEPTT